MPAQFPNSFETPQIVFPQDVGPKFSQPIQTLQDKGYDVKFGLAEQDVPGLAEIAGQPGTREFCPNDLARRWANVDMARKQLAKDGGRAVMQLVARESGQLIGFGWTGAMSDEERSHLPKCTTTFAIRLHEDARGQELATPFTKAILATTMRFCRARNIGLETWGSNRAAVRTYLRAGAELKDVQSSPRPTLVRARGVGVHKRDGQPYINDTRLYMQFPQTM